MVAKDGPQYSRKQVHEELQALKAGKLDSLFKVDEEEEYQPPQLPMFQRAVPALNVLSSQMAMTGIGGMAGLGAPELVPSPSPLSVLSPQLQMSLNTQQKDRDAD